MLSKSKNISLLIEIHNLSTDNTTLYEPIKEFLNSYNFKIEFEKVVRGEKDISLPVNINNNLNLSYLNFLYFAIKRAI